MKKYKDVEKLQNSLLEIAESMQQKFLEIQKSASYINDKSINVEALGANIQEMMEEYMAKASEAYAISDEIQESLKEQEENHNA